MIKKAYSVEIKLACTKMKKQLNLIGRYDTSGKIYTLVKWYQNEVFHRLQQPVGKPCTYGKDMAELSDVEQLKLQKVSRLDKNIDKVAFIKPVEAYKPPPF